MAGKKGKSRGRKAKHGTPASPAASTQAAAHGFKHSQLEGPFPDHNGDPPGSGVAADRFADGSYLPSTVSSSRAGSQVSRVTGGDNPSTSQHQAGTALVAIGGDFRHANDSGGREAVWRRRPSGDRDTGGDRDRPAGDHCHNGESLSGSLYLRQSAARQWSWLGYSAKQFRSFAQEYPPALDVGADQVRAKIDDVKCRACRDSLHNALGKGLARGGLPLTKLVKLAACRSRENPKQGEGLTTGTQLVAESANGRAASSSLLNGRSDIESHTKWGAGAVDRLRIRAPVTPDLLRQIIGVVQASAGAAAVAPVASSPVGGADVKSPGSGTARRRLRDLSAEEWLSTYPAPSAARLEGDACNGLRGTGTGSLAITRAQPSVSVSGDERNPWALMDRTERAKDSAFKCCGVIEVMTGGGVHDPTAASNGGVSANGSAGVGTVSGSVAGSGGGSAIAANMEWNPQFAPRLQEAETALVDWLTELTMALHGLTFQFTLAFVRDEGVAERGGDCGGKSGGGRDDLAESIALTEVLWTAYEESIKKQLDLTLEARREHLREQSQPMGFALCFAAQNRACAAELLERKRAEMAALHEATIGVMRAGKVKPLLVHAERARQRWSGLLVDEELRALDDLVERVLKTRLQIFKCESFAYNASNDVIQAEQMADAQLKAVVQEWEIRMDSFKVIVESRFSEELNPTVYPQSPALTAALQSWLSSFKTDWEENETTQQLHAHIRQRHVQGLCQTLVAKKHRLKTSKEEAAELGKQQRKRDGKAGVSNSNGNGTANGVYLASSEHSEDLVKQRELEERCQSLVTDISLTQQEQIETCLAYRLFAVGQLHQRYRRLRLFFAQLVCRVAARAHLTRHLCGVDSDADERVKMVGACLMLGAVEEACLRWTAVHNERQLVEDIDREDASLDAKRRKRERAKAKVRKNKNASAAAATATVEVVAAKGSIPSEDGMKGERTPSSESALDRAARMSAAGEKSINGSVGEAIARQGIAIAVARVTTSPLPNGTTVGAGAGSRTASRSRGGVGKNSLKADRFPTTPGWRTAERSAPVGDEDGFVTIEKLKTRRSATAQNWRARSWGAGNLDNGSSGSGNDRSRLRGGGGSFNLHGGRGVEEMMDHAARDSHPREPETRARGFVGAEEAAYSGLGKNSATVGRAWTPHRNKPVTEEKPEMCVAAAAAAASSASPASSAASATAGKPSRLDLGETGWSGGPGWRVELSDGGGSISGSGSDASQLSTSVSPASHSVQGPTSCSTQSNGVAAGVRDHAFLQQPQHYIAPQAAPRPASPPEKGRTRWAECRRGPSVALEEELPEAAPAPLERTEEASAGGVVNNAGEFSGGQEVLGAGKKLMMGARGAAAPASAELGPEREIARITKGKVENGDRRVSLEAAKVACGDSVEMQGKPAEREDERAPAIAEAMVRDEEMKGEEEEAYLFQFGTVNLSDDDVVANSGLSGEGQEAQGSPESRRYEGGVVENEDDPRKESKPRPHCEVSPGSLALAEMQFDERNEFAEDSQDLGGGADEAGDGSSLSQPLQTQQLRGGVFFPANSLPSHLPSLQPQQDQEGYTAPHVSHYYHPLQQSHEGHIPFHHQQHQHEVLTQQHGALQQRGFSHDDGMYGVSHFHQHLQSHLPYQRGMGVSGHPLHGSATAGGGMHAPGVEGQGLSQHRRGPSHPKGSRYGSSVGASRSSGQHSPHGGQMMSPLGGQYSVAHHSFSMMQQQGSTPGGYWGGGMMHYHVPGQQMMAPAPGGIGVTDGQAVYYPPPPHMMQGGGSGQDQGGMSWHAGGGGHMAMGIVPGMNILMDLAGDMPKQMPWVPDGGQQHYVHHPTPKQEDWGYAPPPPPTPSLQLQQQQQPPLHAAAHQNQEHHWQKFENVANGVGGVTVSVNDDDSVGERTPGGHGTESVSSPLDEIEGCTLVEIDAVATGAQEGVYEARTSEEEVASPSQPSETMTPAAELANGAVSLFSSVAIDSSITAGAAFAERSGAPLGGGEEVGVADSPEPSEEQCGGGLADPGRPEGPLANDAGREDDDAPFYPRPTDGQSPEAPRREDNVWEEDRVGSAAAPEEGEGSAAVAAVVGAAGAKGTSRSRKGKKAKGQKGQVGSPPGGRGRRKGGRGGNRAKSGAMTGVEVASTTKNGFPSPSGPLPRGLANASGQNNCYLNVVVQSLWHLDAFREKIGGNTNSSTAVGAWGKKPRAWGAAVADVGNDKAPKESSHRVESALRALFRELSGGGGDGKKGEGAGITGTTSASVATLRMALARVPGGRFGLGKMDDAAEAMETILGCLVQGASAAAVQQVFSMRIREVLACPKCGIFSPGVPTTYEANVFYAHMSALQEAREKYPACSFDVALREASLGDLMTCTNADCPLALRRERLPSRRSITGEPPSVFSLGLVWNNWGPALVADLLEMLSRVIDLDVVFCKPSNKRGGGGVPGMVWPLEEDVSFGKAYLKGFFCFHVQKHHYVAYVYNRGRGEWLLLDDDKAIPIGPEFSGVLARCKKDELHPSLFFYERQHPLA